MRERQQPAGVVAFVILFGVLTLTGQARADGHDDALRPIIEAGREAEIAALFSPLEMEAPLPGGCLFVGVSVEMDTITARVDCGGESGSLTLSYPTRDAAGHEGSRSFAMRSVSADPRGQVAKALALLTETVRGNDDGEFWRRRALTAPGALDSLRRLGARGGPTRFLTDGALMTALLLLAVSGLLWRVHRRTKAWTLPEMALVFALGATLRVLLSPETVLNSWPFVRVPLLAELTFRGPVLAQILSWTGGSVDQWDVVFATNLLLSTLLPPVAMGAAAALEGRGRTALFAGLSAAALPSLLRFAHSDVFEVLSVLLGGLSLLAAYVTLSDERRLWRWLALVALAALLLALSTARPLDPLLALVLLGFACSRRGQAASWRRWLPSAIVLTGLGLTLLLLRVAELKGAASASFLSNPQWLQSIATAFSPSNNTLVMPHVTPIAFMAAGLLGGYALWTTGRRRELAVLLLWVVLFKAGHSVVQPRNVSLQARYDLVFALPVALLVGVGVQLLWSWRRVVGAVALAAVLVAPALHGRFLQGRFNEQNEFDFLRQATVDIPDACGVAEYRGPADDEVESRLARFSAVVRAGIPVERWRLLQGFDIDETRGDVGCLYAYRGLACWARGAPHAQEAADCRRLVDDARWRPVQRFAFDSATYDPNMRVGLEPNSEGVPIALGLYVYDPDGTE